MIEYLKATDCFFRCEPCQRRVWGWEPCDFADMSVDHVRNLAERLGAAQRALIELAEAMERHGSALWWSSGPEP